MASQLLLIVLAVAGCVGFYWLVLKLSSARIEGQYRLLAERFGLELHQPPARFGGFLRMDPSAYGHYRGRELSFSAPGKGLKGSRQTESVVKVELKVEGTGNQRLRAELAPAGILGTMRRWEGDGGQARWKSGRQAFDEAVEVRANEAAGRILATVLQDDERSRWLAGNLKKAKAALYIGDGTIAYARMGLIADDTTRKGFEDVVEFLCDLAEAMES